MKEPTSREEYERRYTDGVRYEGHFTDMAQHLPCPFCTAPDFMVMYPFRGILPGDGGPDLDAQMSDGGTCDECGRSVRMIVTREGGSIRMETVQTGGPDPPDVPWLPPMRRIDGGTDPR